MPIEAEPHLCLFQNSAFTAMGPPVFRRAEADGAPVMVVRLGDRDAAFPLRSLQRSLDIAPESEDGRMLGLVADSLGFVQSLRLGEPLPAEVLSGNASWSPDPVHARLATCRLKLRLLDWHAGVEPELSLPNGGNVARILRATDTPAQRARVIAAFAAAAETLGLPDPMGVVVLVEDLASELAFVEALRERFLAPLHAFVATLAGLTRGDGINPETLLQVQRLSAVGCAKVAERFSAIDARVGRLIDALRELETTRIVLRTHRDWLYRGQRAWEPVLADWNQPHLAEPGLAAARLARAYRFLAPRFMPMNDWLQARRPARPAGALPEASPILW